MKKIVRVLLVVLAIAMLVTCFAACGGNKDKNTDKKPTGGNNNNNNNSSNNTVVDPGYEMPEKVDLDKYTYRAYVRSNVSTGDPFSDGNPAFYCEDFWINPEEGEPEDALAFAVYHRNKDIENDYNVTIRQVSQTINMTQELARFVQNGDRFDLTIILAKSAANAATQNLLTELNGAGLNLSNEAYDQNAIKELSIANKLYYVSGDMNISTLDSVAHNGQG